MSFLARENSRATLLLGYVREHMPDTGNRITYDEVIDVIDLDASEITTRDLGSVLSGVVAEVNKRLHRDGDWRHLANIETVGYQIATPAELREESMSRMRRTMRMQVANQRAIEKAIRHPDSTPGERKRAADAAAAQAALLTLIRREQRKIRHVWPAEETSPVDSTVTP